MLTFASKMGHVANLTRIFVLNVCRLLLGPIAGKSTYRPSVYVSIINKVLQPTVAMATLTWILGYFEWLRSS